MFFLLIHGCLTCIIIHIWWCKFRTEIPTGKHLKMNGSKWTPPYAQTGVKSSCPMDETTNIWKVEGRVRQFLPNRKNRGFFHGFFRLEETVSSSFFRWNSEETQKWGEIVFSSLIHLRFLILSFIYGRKLLNYTKISFQDMLDNNLYDPMGTYISCWMVIFSLQTTGNSVLLQVLKKWK